LESRIFPDRNQFIEFLQVGESDERIHLALSIIRRMCFDSNYPPPYRILQNLIDCETDIANESKTMSYTAQDHFVHIVNLYLLGIYVFFNHPTLNKVLINCFANKRNESTQNRNLHSVKDFISSWKYFCLYHDASYPIEILYKKGGEPVPDREYKAFLDLYNHIPELLCKEYLAEAVAKLIVITQVLSDEQNMDIVDLFANLSYSFDCGNKHTLNVSEIVEQYSGYIGIDKLYTFDNVKLILNFVPKDELLTVLIDITTGNPVAFTCFNAIENRQDIFAVHNSSGRFTRERLETILVDDDQFLDDKFRVMYFIQDVTKLKSKILDICGVSDQDVSHAVHVLEKKDQLSKLEDASHLDFYRIEDAEEFGEYLFRVYENSLATLEDLFQCKSSDQYYIPPRFTSAGVVYPENQARIYDGYMKKELVGIISSTLTEHLGHAIPSIISDELVQNKPSTKEDIQEILLGHLQELFSDVFLEQMLKITSDKASDDIIGHLTTEIKESNAMIRVFLKLSERLGFKDVSEDSFLTEMGFSPTKLLEKCREDAHINALADRIDARLKRERGVNLSDIMERYKPEYVRYNHGISASLLYLYSNSISSAIINDTRDKKAYAKELKLLIWDADARIMETKLVSNYRFVIEQAAYSILCHNIYVSEFRDSFNKSWLIKLNQSPFSYFCILMDSLQIWNRTKYYSHSSRTWEPEFSYSNYDIVIEDDQLVIHFLSNIKNFEDLKKKKVDDLNTFLENCTDHISLEMRNHK